MMVLDRPVIIGTLTRIGFRFDDKPDEELLKMASSAEVAAIFEEMTRRFKPEKAQGVDALIQFDLNGDAGGQYWVKIVDGTCNAGVGLGDNPRITIKTPVDVWVDVAGGKTNVINAFMMGKLKVVGDMSLAIKIQSMFGL
jgi:putative sterol carrier protein